MTPERWAMVEEIFQSAAERPPATRDAYLDGACGADTALREEVASLLAETERARSLSSLGLASVPEPARALAGGTRLGVYEIQALIGAGGMGEVYRARDTKLGRDVAIKVLSRMGSADPDRLGRFQREARVLASLNHPNIGAIYGVEETGGISALVLELVDGETLAERIAQGAVAIADAIMLARQIADALDAAHEKGIVHRDLKPANIKITSSGMVKVLDFGLAKLTKERVADPVPSLSASGGAPIRLGTAAYMSPEQARGQAVDKRTDVWAFGCVLYEMLTGQRAFPGERSSDTIAAVIDRDPMWQALPPGTPAGVRRVLRRTLEKEPGRRLRDIADARLDLEEAAGPDEAAATRPHHDHRLKEWLVAGAVTIVVLTVMIAIAARFLRTEVSGPLPSVLELSTPPTDEPMSFALSPDGRRLAFVASTGGNSRLWVRPLALAQASPLSGTDRAMMPFWSPDGRAIGFFADGKLKRVDVAGGVPQVIADAPTPRGGTWNREGIILFAPFTAGNLLQVPASGGRALATTARGRWPQFLPDGRRFLSFVGPAAPEVRGVYLGSLDGGEQTRIVPSESASIYVPPDHLLVVHEGTLLAWRFDPVRGAISGDPSAIAEGVGSDGRLGPAFSVTGTSVLVHRAGSGQRRQFIWTDRSGNVVGTVVPPDDTGLAHPELAPDGERVAFQRYQQGSNNIWLLDLSRDVATQLTMNGGICPLWTRDGAQIIFSDLTHLFVKTANEVTAEQVLPLDAPSITAFDMSPDRRWLLYTIHSPQTGSDLWLLPLDGRSKPFPIVQTPGEDTSGQFSPDGRWILYQSDMSGRYEVYMESVSGRGERVRISTSGGFWPRWSRDGKELFYVAPDEQLMAVGLSVRSRGEMPQPGAPTALFRTRFARGGNVTRAGGVAKAQYSVAADGRFLMNVATDPPTTHPIMVVFNWQSAHGASERQ